MPKGDFTCAWQYAGFTASPSRCAHASNVHLLCVREMALQPRAGEAPASVTQVAAQQASTAAFIKF